MALQQTLGRPVEIGEVRYQVFPRPGLSATNLVIPDEAAFGLEPIAYVGEMQAAISFTSVLTGNLEISSVRLVEASVNLARSEEAGWNFARLLERMTAGVKRGGGAEGGDARFADQLPRRDAEIAVFPEHGGYGPGFAAVGRRSGEVEF